LFVSAVCFTLLLGALIADGWLDKYRAIILLLLVYCLGVSHWLSSYHAGMNDWPWH